MEEFNRINKKVRNIGLIAIVIAIVVLIIWVILFILSKGNRLEFMLAIAIALFLAGLLIVTRIQYIIWVSKNLSKERNLFQKLFLII
ncbi:MAG: hypothetical protein ACFE8E_07545 [Candidatus Hodarchaeota archaeon]